jgi:hypothetical protein
MRELQREREREQERKKKRKKEEEAKRLKEKADKEKADRDKAIATIKAQTAKRGWVLTATGARKFNMTKGNDFMAIEVLQNGNVRVNTPGTISSANHKSADDFQDNLKKILGGTWRILKHHFVPSFGRAAVAHDHTHPHSH